jgi:alpha-amylase/alpha-mannosidase (GH57 family)
VTTDVLVLWHMHQPRYVHPASGRLVMPWVRLHAAAGYLDMARALERRPGARVTVNFVPSLVEQIEEILGGATDALEDAARKPTTDLDEADRLLLLGRCFSVRRDRVIAPRPRYAELLAKRGEDGRESQLLQVMRRFTTEDLRDLQCLFLLGWLGFAAREDDPAIGVLDAKGRGYSEDDKQTLGLAVRAAVGRVLPAWKALAARGQVELVCSPFYHPIVPLLCDSDAARRSRPKDALPPRFRHAEDARQQIRLARAAHERVFGARALGMWPPEGSLSPEAVQLYREEGVEWLAADEGVLANSRGGSRNRFWRHDGVALVFRDREMSDRIGFRYQDAPAAAAAADLCGAARAQGNGVVGVFLDGENAWESYPRRGADFLDAFYAQLEGGHGVRSRTISEALAERGVGGELPELWSGSWIDASFRIWIGDPDKNRGWELLGETRARVAAAPEGPGKRAAERLLLIAEGSDWFWWYGEPFSSAEDALFDELFRAHLEGAWRAIGLEPPAALAEPIGHEPVSSLTRPAAYVHPRLDGKADRYYEWHGAGEVVVGRGAAMADSGHAIERLHLGFDEERLYLRLVPEKKDRRRVAASRLVLHVRVGERPERTIRVLCGAPDGGEELAALGGKVGAIDVVEVGLPLAALGAAPRDELRVWMSLETAGVTYARVPRDGNVMVVAPWQGWDAENWHA